MHLVRSAPFSRVFLLFTTFTAVFFVLGGTYAFVERIGANLGMSQNAIGLGLGLSTIAGIAGALLAGWVGLRIGRPIPLITGYLLGGLSCSLTP